MKIELPGTLKPGALRRTDWRATWPAGLVALVFLVGFCLPLAVALGGLVLVSQRFGFAGALAYAGGWLALVIWLVLREFVQAEREPRTRPLARTRGSL